MNGQEIYVTPLKIKHLREFMAEFTKIKDVLNEQDSLDVLLECMRISMRQYAPELKTKELVEDSMDMETLYKILEIGAGIKLKEDAEESIQEQAQSDENSSWDSIDLISLESEVFLLGIWKDYQELEESLCMEELSEILNAKRENDYNEKKFLAAMQGIDLDEQTGNKKKNAWEEMKARVFSNNKTSDPDDILSLSGPAARKAGFGIGNGIGYEKWD